MDKVNVGNNGERTIAGTNDWGYFAHLSIYEFFSVYAKGKRLLEIGSGTGYGADHLASVAAHITSLDIDRNANAYCKKTFGSKKIDFRLHDLSQAVPEGAPFEMIVSSNALEHIPAIDQLLRNSTNAVIRGGMFMVAVPPINSPKAYAENFRNPFHITNLTPINWYTKLSRFYSKVQCFRHWVVPSAVGDDEMPIEMALPPGQTRIRQTDFIFEEMSYKALQACQHCITCVFIASGPLEIHGEATLAEELPRDWHTGLLCAQIMQEEVSKQAELTAYYNQEFARVSAELIKTVAYYKGELARLNGEIDLQKSYYKSEIATLEAYAAGQVQHVKSLAKDLHIMRSQKI